MVNMAQTRGDRLRIAREKKYKSARLAGKAMGIPVSTYGAHERAETPGCRDYGPDEAKRTRERYLIARKYVERFTAAQGVSDASLVNAELLKDGEKQQLKYYLGMTDQHPQYDRYTYKEKFEYWGLVIGNVIMVTTGFILFFPVQAANLIPGQIIPAAKVAHSNEGLMAFFVITIWHIFNAHLNPDVFPFDASIFTGKVSRERYVHEHPLELARLEGGAPPDVHGVHAAPGHGAKREVV